MSLVTPLALCVVVAVALYMLTLGAASLFAPGRASRFLLGFAGSPSVHFLELSLRLIAGAALVLYAPHMRFSTAFELIGWVLLSTTACLLLVPWRWHRAFSQRMVPRATRFIALIGVTSLSFGGLVLFAVIGGRAD